METFPRTEIVGKKPAMLSIPLADARRLLPGHAPRVCCRFYDALPRLLPNGLPRTTPLVAYARIVIGGAFIVEARVLRDGVDLPPSKLEVERLAFDEATGRYVFMPNYGPEVIRSIYDTLAVRQVLLNARRSAAGRRN